MADIYENTKMDAVDILKTYAEFIRNDVRADDFERHPYLPHIEQTIEDLSNTQRVSYCDCEKSHNGLGLAGRECDCAAPPAMDREAVLEALELADATLRGANMDRAFVERKVTAAITGLKSTSTVPADTMIILHALLTEYAGQPNQAGEAYKLVDATLSADAIRQGEGSKVEGDVTYEVWQDDQQVAGSTDDADARHYLEVYGQDSPAKLMRVVTVRTEIAATPASHASDGGKA